MNSFLTIALYQMILVIVYFIFDIELTLAGLSAGSIAVLIVGIVYEIMEDNRTR